MAILAMNSTAIKSTVVKKQILAVLGTLFGPLLLISSVLFIPVARAEGSPSNSTIGTQSEVAASRALSQGLRKGLMGKSTEDIVKLLGRPDEKRGKDGATTETWFYGKSFLVFSGQSVVAWSDKGELESRRGHQRIGLKEKKKRGGQFRRDGWKNPWTPGKSVSADDVLDTIIE